MTIPIEAMRALWHESERKLYPLATTVPDKYEQVIRLARAVANELGEVTTSDGLVERWETRSAVVQAASEREGVPVGDLPETDIAGVAFSLRHNEIRAAEHHNAMCRLITEARNGGQPWVVLHERGRQEHGLMDPYQAIEMHLGSGIGLVTSVEVNPVDGKANYVLTVIRLDPMTGAPTDIDPGIADTQELADPSSYAAGRTEIRALIERYSRVNNFPIVDGASEI